MKILFVCLGNICRSAIAEGVLKNKAEQQNIPLTVDSAGTSAHHVGEAPDHRMQKKGKEHGIDISNQHARQFSRADFDAFDYIFAMDTSNHQNIIRLASNDNDLKKVQLFMDLTNPKEQLSVPDPYYGGEQGFEDVFQLVNKGCDQFIEKYCHV